MLLVHGVADAVHAGLKLKDLAPQPPAIKNFSTGMMCNGSMKDAYKACVAL